MNAEQQKFTDEMSSYIKKYAPKYGITICSAILAQCCLESDWGRSELAVNANNYFGLKYKPGRCPTAIGNYIKVGSEQNPDGSYKSSTMTWYKFRNKEECVVGYFDFINNKKYENLKGVTDPKTYLQNIKSDGYATSLEYVNKNMNVITKNDLTKYDSLEKPKDDVLYKVQVGAYSVKSNAEDMLKKLKKAGFDGFIVEVKK